MAPKTASAILADPNVQARRAAMRQPAGGGMQSAAMPPRTGSYGAPVGGMQPGMQTATPPRMGASPYSGAMGGQRQMAMPGMAMPPGGGTMRTQGYQSGPMPMPGAPSGSQMSPLTMGRAGGTPLPGPAPGGGGPVMGGGGRAVPQAPPGEGPGGLYGGGTDEYGLPYDAKGRKKFKGYGFAKKLRNKGPAWMQDQGMYGTALDTINQILGRQGQISPERMIQEQAGIEQGRGQGQQALQARMAAAGIDPSSPQAMSMGGSVDQAANRMQAENRRSLDIQAEDRQRNDLNLVLPYLQAMLGLTTKRGGGGVQALPMQGGGGAGPDYAGMAAGAGNAVLSNYQNMPWAK